MPRHRETKIVPYSAEQMFDLVADIERYPEFLPWVIASRKLRSEPDGALHEIAVGFKMVREKYTSRVTLDRPHTIKARFVRGPMRHLRSDWAFTPRADGGCEIEFELDFEFKSRILQKLIGPLFHDAIMRMVRSFEGRARALYGERGNEQRSADGSSGAVNLSPPKPAR